MAKVIYFIRHGNTAKAKNDLDRELTEKGMEQAQARREALGNPTFDLILSSPAMRAMQTAALVAGVPIEEVTAVNTLYMPEDATDRAAMEVMFTDLMYSPLRTYRTADKTGVLYRYGLDNELQIRNAIKATGAKKVLTAGHAVMINTVVSSFNDNDTDLVLDASLGEAEGFKLTLDDGGKVTNIELIV